MYSYRRHNNAVSDPENIELIRLRAEINQLGTELTIANKRIHQMSNER